MSEELFHKELVGRGQANMVFFRKKGWVGAGVDGGIQGKSCTLSSSKGLITLFYSCYVKSGVDDTIKQIKNPRDLK